jgi:transcriptional regulator with XRE-family HTH domain
MTDVARRALGTAIARARSRAGLSQDQLGTATGLGQTAISRIETGDRKVEALELVTIGDELGVPAADLIGATRTLGDPVEVVALRIGESDDARALGPVLEALRRVEDLEDRLS